MNNEPDDLEFLSDQLRAKSASDREIVLPFADALRAIDLLQQKGARGVAWEGWIRDSVRLGHSARHQGTVGYFAVEE